MPRLFKLWRRLGQVLAPGGLVVTHRISPDVSAKVKPSFPLLKGTVS